MLRVGILVLFLNLEERFQLFTTEHEVSCWFVINGLYYVEICSLYTHFDESFYHEWMLNFVKCFFCIYWDDRMIFLPFFFLMWCITLTGLRILDHPCIPGINPTWSWCMILFIYCWIQLTNILLRIFASTFIRDIGL